MTTDKSISSIARGTSSVGVVECLTKRVSSSTHSVVEESTSCASEASSVLPLSTEKVCRGTVVGLVGEFQALTKVQAVASIARGTSSVGVVEGLALRVRLNTESSSEVSCSSASHTLGVSPFGTQKIGRSTAVGLIGEPDALTEVEAISSIA